MNDLSSLILRDNWQLFEDVNGMAGHNSSLDSLMKVSASDLIFLLPLLLVGFWFLFARYSPLLRAMRLGRPGDIAHRRLAQQMALLGCGAVVLALAFNVILGHLLYEPRPFVSHPQADHLLVGHAADASFPSDHTAIAFAIAMTLVLYVFLVVAAWMPGKGKVTLADRVRGLGPLTIPAIIAGVALLAAIVIGFARVYVGVHYPGDIAGGAGCGFLAASILATLRPRLAAILNRVIELAERLRLA